MIGSTGILHALDCFVLHRRQVLVEQAVLAEGGCVVRLAGLYHAQVGAEICPALALYALCTSSAAHAVHKTYACESMWKTSCIQLQSLQTSCSVHAHFFLAMDNPVDIKTTSCASMFYFLLHFFSCVYCLCCSRGAHTPLP